MTGETLGRYHLLDQIGQGGMATVYKAYDPTQERYVALKVLSPALAQQEQFIERFRREASVVVQLRHPHVVPVENFGEEGGYAYLVMPYIEGGSLTDHLMRDPPSSTFGARIVEQVAGALEYAHGRGVVHRDVKPSNILIDEEGNALLSDFGLARIHDASSSLTGSALIGTPAYMAPEQARGETVDPRSDQYSFGVILYQLSTGHLPFEAETPMAVLIKHMNDPIPLPRAVSAHVPEAIERVILKATAKDPAHRFGSVAELNATFQAALAHALDPRAHPAPKIELPPEVQRVHQQPTVLMRNRWIHRAAIGASLLFLLLACPVTASGLRGLLDRASSPAEGSGLLDPELNSFQLTALAGTIEAMSTELAAAQGGLLSPDDVQTAVIETLAASVPIVDNPTGVVAAPTYAGTATPDLDSGAAPSYSATPAATDTSTPSATLPTRTPTPGISATSTASTPPTSTPTTAPPSTPTPTPTNTLLPPTAAPASTPSGSGDVCSTSSLSGFSVSGKNVIWTFTNGGSTSIEITETVIVWPSSNAELLKVYLGSSLIWKETDGSPPTTLGSDWAEGSRTLAPGDAKPLKFEFDKNAAASGYSLTITLSGVCQLSAGG